MTISASPWRMPFCVVILVRVVSRMLLSHYVLQAAQRAGTGRTRAASGRGTASHTSTTGGPAAVPLAKSGRPGSPQAKGKVCCLTIRLPHTHIHFNAHMQVCRYVHYYMQPRRDSLYWVSGSDMPITLSPASLQGGGQVPDLTGFHAKRLEFEPEYDADAEALIADLEFRCVKHHRSCVYC